MKSITAKKPRKPAGEALWAIRREEILDAAARLFARHGYPETDTQLLADELGVGKGTLYRYFASKEELFFAVLAMLLQPYVIDFAEEAGALDEKAQILKLIESYLLFVRDNANSIRFFVAQLLHDEKASDGLTGQVLALYEGYRSLLTGLITQAQEKGFCTRHFSPELAAGFLLSTLNGMLIGYLFLGNQGLDLEGAIGMLRQWLFND